MQATAAGKRRRWTVAALKPELRTRGPLFGLAGLSVAAAVLIFSLGEEFSFFRDEWYFIAYRGGDNIDSYLAPHAGHLSLIPAAAFTGLFETAGLSVYWPYRVLVIGCHIATAVLLFLLVRRRVGPVAALAPAAVLLFFGPGWMDILWPFQVGFLASAASGLGALLCLESRPGRRRAPCVLLSLSVASSSVGLAFLAAGWVHWLVTGRRRRSVWVPLIPSALFGLWWLAYGREASQFKSENVALGPEYVMDTASAAAGAIVGLRPDYGRLLLLGLAILIAWRFLKRAPLTRATAVLVSLALSFWVLTALARAGENDPAASRYLYPGALFLLLVLAELGRRVEWDRRELALLAVSTAVVLLVNVNGLVEGSEDPATKGPQVRAAAGALELVQQRVDPAFDLGPYTGGAAPILAGPYRDAVRRWNSDPGFDETELARRDDKIRGTADRVLAAALQVTATPALRVESTGSLELERVTGARLRVSRGCVVGRPNGPGATYDFAYPSSGIAVRLDPGPPGQVLLRRFAASFPAAPVLGPLQGAFHGFIRIPRDRSTRPWHVRIRADQTIRLCRLRPGPV